MSDCSWIGKLKRCKGLEGEDRISGLPDDILSHIMTRLTLKEAVTTSILSKRWIKLWLSLPILDFKELKRLLWPYMDKYVQIVNKILQQYNSPKLHKLRIVYPLRGSCRDYIDDWISIAIKNCVSELELNFSIFPISGPVEYCFPAHVFGEEEIILPTTTSLFVKKHFDSLRDLCLRSVNLSDQGFDLILSSCLSLERFLLMWTYGLVNAKNSTPHLKLKSLELYACRDLEHLQLLAPNLISFKYQGRERTLCLKDAKQLASLRLSIFTSGDPNSSSIFPRGKNFIFSQFSSYLPKIQSFVVSAHLFKNMSDFTELCVFSNLKQLVVDVTFPFYAPVCYRVVASIIRAAPFLEVLEIVIPSRLSRWEFQPLGLASMSPHQNLKELKLFGFRGDERTMEFLSYLLDYAICLQKIEVSPHDASRLGENLRTTNFQDIGGDDAEHFKNYMSQLRQSLNANTQLVFHDG